MLHCRKQKALNEGQKTKTDKKKRKEETVTFSPKPGVKSVLLKQTKGRKERQQPKRNIK